MREIVFPSMMDILSIFSSSLVLSIPYSYFTARFWMRIQNPVVAFIAVIALSFFLGMMNKRRTLTSMLSRSISIYILSRFFSTAISAFILTYPFIGPGVDVSQTYASLFVGLLEWAVIHSFFSIGVPFMLIGGILSPETQRK